MFHRTTGSHLINTPDSTFRLNKFISDTGLCSRREADRLIEEGRVRVNGQPAQLGARVTTQDRIEVNGKPLGQRSVPVYLAYYKPTGVVCTTDEAEPDNITRAVNYPERIFPIGRLDKYSEGLILLTNDGDIVNKILRAGNAHEKEYLVTVDRPLTEVALEAMRQGIPMMGTVTQPCQVTRKGAETCRIVLTQGLNRQIRRMCEYLDYRVMRLTRVRIMHLNTQGLKPGQWRKLTEDEVSELEKRLLNSSKTKEASLPKVRRPLFVDRTSQPKTERKIWKRPR